MKTGRICQDHTNMNTKIGPKNSQKKERIQFSRSDGLYMHGSCRGTSRKPRRRPKVETWSRRWHLAETAKQVAAQKEADKIAGLVEQFGEAMKDPTRTSWQRLESFAEFYRATGRHPMEMSIVEFRLLTGLMTQSFWEEARALFREEVQPEESKS